MMDWYRNGMGGCGFMFAAMTIFWVPVILAGVMIFRGGSGRRSGGGTEDSGAFEILKDGFVRVDVDGEEYEARKAALRGSAR